MNHIIEVDRHVVRTYGNTKNSRSRYVYDEFKVKINEMKIKCTYFIYERGDLYGARLKFSNPLVSKHPDYKYIREEVMKQISELYEEPQRIKFTHASNVR